MRSEDEIKGRLRRIETRLTKYMESQGFETETRKPRWIEGCIQVPTRACAIADCLAVIPEDWRPLDPIDVFVHDEYLMTVYLDNK